MTSTEALKMTKRNAVLCNSVHIRTTTDEAALFTPYQRLLDSEILVLQVAEKQQREHSYQGSITIRPVNDR